MIEAVLLCLVVGVSDGDTLKARCGDSPAVPVPLSEIDAPEKAQPFWRRSRERLATLCSGQQAEIRPSSRDRNGRTVARVFCAGTNANAAIVRAGMAWAYTRYLTYP